ncbi:MAG: hypothetical protein ABIQ59_01250 [Nocardioidaceae bacterium]
MSESDGTGAGARPRQVTVGGVMAAAACALLVVTLFDSMSTVRSADMRDQIADRLSRAPASGLGLDVDQVVALLRGVVLFSGALAAAGVVLAVFVLQRHRGARIGLSVVAGLMLVSATFVSGLLPVLVAVAATMLWGREARDWFAGRAPRAAAERGADGPPAPDRSAVWPTQPTYPAQQPGPAPTVAPTGTGSEVRPGPAGQPFGVAPAATARAAPTATHPGHPGLAHRAPARPTAVTVAAWLTWAFSALVVLLFSLMVLVILVDHAAVVEALQRNQQIAGQGLSGDEILGALWVTSALSITWALAAMALAVLAYRRVELGRILLLVSAAVSSLVCLVAVPVGWLNAVAALVCVAMLNRPSTKAWFAGRDVPPRQQQAPPQGPPQPLQPRQPREKPPVW